MGAMPTALKANRVGIGPANGIDSRVFLSGFGNKWTYIRLHTYTLALNNDGGVHTFGNRGTGSEERVSQM